jgi:nicotinate-nucleotide adenylyltransferase
MQTLCFGGSFNPIHVGHTFCAAAAARAAGFKRVLLIPAAVSPLKLDAAAKLASPVNRLAMCRLAAAADAAAADDASVEFDVDDLELRRPPPSFTIRTVRELRERRNWSNVAWLIGADQVAAFPRWHEAGRLIEEAQIFVMARPGFVFDFDALPPMFRRLRDNVVETPLVDVSATEIRRRVAAGESISGLVAPSVERYIAERGLYR